MKAISHRSTSGLMRHLFGDDMHIIQPAYDEVITELARSHPSFVDTFEECRGRTAFLLPYFATEYGHFSSVGSFLPTHAKPLVIGYSLICLAIAVDDDVVDEFRHDPIRTMKMLCTAELLCNEAYSTLVKSTRPRERDIVLETIHDFLTAVTEFQYKDIIFIAQTCRKAFQLDDYLRLTYKTGCIFDKGFDLGLQLASADEAHRRLGGRVSRAIGCALQLLDDLLDLEDDQRSFGEFPITYPMVTRAKQGTFDDVFALIESKLGEAKDCSARFKHPMKVLSTIDGLKAAVRKVKGQVDSLTAR